VFPGVINEIKLRDIVIIILKILFIILII
jgi:hypothetical protein